MVQKIKDNLQTMRREISIIEYLFWWATRIFMLMYIVRQLGEDHQFVDYVLPILVGLGTIGVLLIRLIFPRKTFFSRISFHAQTCLCLLAVTGSIGNYFGLYSVDGTLHYDWILHVVSGIPITLVGYYMLQAMDNGTHKLTAQNAAAASMGFSFMIIIAWEIMEFCGDFLYGDNNQKYDWIIGPNDPFYPLFSRSLPGAAQSPLIDTLVDMTTAFFTTLFTGVILFIVLWSREKAAEKKAAAAEIPEPAAVNM